MPFGHNSNVTIAGDTYHVQTEERGAAHALIDTTVYLRGRVLHRRTNSFSDLLPLDSDREEALKLRVDTQHRKVVDEIRSGKLCLADPAGAKTPSPAPAPAESAARIHLEQQPAPQAAMIAIENATGEIKAMVGGYSFEDSKFNRATQAFRQVGSSFKPYVYSTVVERGASPFDTVVDAPFTVISGGQPYSPHNYDEKFEGTITLRRALAGSRNVPAVKLTEKVGVNAVVDMARRFGITTPLPPYLPLALGAADMRLIEHVSAFTVFPNEGIRIDPHMIRRVTSYDGALLEEAHPEVHDVLAPDVAHTMTAMLEEVVQFGTAIKAKSIGRPAGGKTGTTQDFTDAWFIGFTPQITAGVWVGFDDKQISLGKRETGAAAALPIWMEFIDKGMEGMPDADFVNVESLEEQANEHHVHTDVPDTAPEDEAPALQKPPTTVSVPGTPPALAASPPTE